MTKNSITINFLFLFFMSSTLLVSTITTQTYELKNWLSWALDNPTKIAQNDVDNLRLHLTHTANVSITQTNQQHFQMLLSKLAQKVAQLSPAGRTVFKAISEFEGKTSFVSPNVFAFIKQTAATIEKMPPPLEKKSYVAKINSIKGKKKVLEIISALILLVDGTGKEDITTETQQAFFALINQIWNKKDRFTPHIQTAFVSLLEKALASTFLTDNDKTTVPNYLAQLKGTATPTIPALTTTAPATTTIKQPPAATTAPPPTVKQPTVIKTITKTPPMATRRPSAPIKKPQLATKK